MFLVLAVLMVTLQGDNFSCQSLGTLNILNNMTFFSLSTCRNLFNMQVEEP